VLPPQPEPIIITRENPVNEELYAKFNMAQAEIERLKAQIAALSTPAAQELRRRTRKLSDPDSVAASDVQTIVEGGESLQQEGVPLQVVVIIALGVFVMTYLFF
jgi:prefoldin subunit 5